MDPPIGFEEVYIVLFEHSFRYFGFDSPITRQFYDASNWKPTIAMNDNNLINLIDANLRENNEAYLDFLYVMNYYMFDSFHNKLKIEVQNPLNRKINPNELSFKFDEEELRKVMGNIGFLLLKEPSLLNSTKHDYVELYFQIKKLWSIIITKRYLDDEKFPIEEIKTKIKKSFCIARLMQIEKAKVAIQNFLVSFDQIYKDKEEVNKHIIEFFEEFCARYFSYINIGLGRFIKDFCLIIKDKFTSIDLLKENIPTLNPTDEFHKLLINYLRDESNNLQTESSMQQFIELMNEKYRELYPSSSNLIDGLDEQQPEPSPHDNEDQNSDLEDNVLNNNPNLNETSLHESQSTAKEENNNNHATSANNNENSQISQNYISASLEENMSFTTITTTTPQENINDDNQANELDRSMSENPVEDLDNQIANQIDDPFDEIENLTGHTNNCEEADLVDQRTQLNIDDNAEPINQTQSTQEDEINQESQLIPDLTEVSSDNKKSSVDETNPNSSMTMDVVEEQNETLINNQAADILNRSNNSSTGLSRLTELTSVPVNNTVVDDQIDIQVPTFSDDTTNESNQPAFKDNYKSFLQTVSQASSTFVSPSKRPRNAISDDSDDFGDITASNAINNPTTLRAFSFDYDEPTVFKKTPTLASLIDESENVFKKKKSNEVDFNPSFFAKSTPSNSKQKKTSTKATTKVKILSKNTDQVGDKDSEELADSNDDVLPKQDFKKKDDLISKESRKRKSSNESKTDELSNDSKRKQPTKRIQSIYSSDESSQQEELTKTSSSNKAKLVSLSEEEYERIIKNQPKIILRSHGKMLHNDRMLKFYD